MIESGRQSLALLDRLDKLDGQLTELHNARKAVRLRRIALPEDLPALYRTYIDDIVGTLSKELVVCRSGDALRDLIDRLVVHYEADREAHTVAIEGRLSELRSAAHPKVGADYRASERSLTLVAGAGFEPATFRL